MAKQERPFSIRPYPLGFKKEVIFLYQYVSLRETSFLFNVSTGSIINWAKGFGVKIPRRGYPRRKRHERLQGLNLKQIREANHNEHRYVLLHVYNYTCYDCGLYDPSGLNLQFHLDYDTIPVQALILCTKCHGKRHRKKTQLA